MTPGDLGHRHRIESQHFRSQPPDFVARYTTLSMKTNGQVNNGYQRINSQFCDQDNESMAYEMRGNYR